MTAPRQKRGIGGALGAALLALTVSAMPAGAGPVEDKQAQASSIAAKLDSQASSIVALDKERRRAEDALAVADSAVARAQDDLALATQRQDEARRLLAVQAQVAYVDGGSVSFIGRMVNASVNDAAARRTYLQIASGEDRQAIGRLQASKEDLRATQLSLQRAQQTAAAKAKATDAEKARMDQAVAAQRALLTRTNGELSALVAADQARRDAESARLVAAAAPAPVPAAAPASASGGAATTAVPAGSSPAPTSAPASPKAAAASASSSSTDATFACIRQLESGNNYSSPGGGAYQFTDATWQSLGYKGSAQDAPPAVQDEAARKLQARDGWSPWTTAALCGRV